MRFYRIIAILLFVGANVSAYAQDIKSKPDTPTSLDPVQVSASIVSTEDPTVKTLIFNVAILEGYHIYAYVSPQDPYIQSKLKLELPEGVTNLGELQTPTPTAYPGKGELYVYTGNIQFKQPLKIAEDYNNLTAIKCGLFYQTCNANICLPPIQKDVLLTLKN
ncbi:protein-disulfide reductase DsbD N-terminal domain-containing protein [Cellulophaga omnivescoria]|uniref:protein-disulfide reductase DsbD N-terminal domain-containing protein n=1 Tax=Cellulophaga omnivescoria TaxID=1888890 RepID=UPI000986CD52|nr:protein-disulfide reductase DsbD domain-containing protein [Cellulophaga omnivescoria]WBU88648.1 protein-disulfide reductase DsbD family protein [Cellulophaga omnivescoria]